MTVRKAELNVMRAAERNTKITKAMATSNANTNAGAVIKLVTNVKHADLNVRKIPDQLEEHSKSLTLLLKKLRMILKVTTQ